MIFILSPQKIRQGSLCIFGLSDHYENLIDVNSLNFFQIWGDGRAIGGHKNTAVAISPVGNGLILNPPRNLKVHSPLLAMSVRVYSGDDHRLALSANIGGWLDEFVTHDNDVWYLTGDTMFLNAVEGDFHPRKVRGIHSDVKSLTFIERIFSDRVFANFAIFWQRRTYQIPGLKVLNTLHTFMNSTA